MRIFLAVAAILSCLASPVAALEQSGVPTAFADNASWQTCFTPGQDCTGAIAMEIRQARTTLLIQAYEFTSEPIIAAVIDAHARGVDVRAILDRSQLRSRRIVVGLLVAAGIPVRIDARPAIAHNKVLLIDGTVVITGSFNFTRAAQSRNAENVLIIRNDAALASDYTRYWHDRERLSIALGDRLPDPEDP